MKIMKRKIKLILFFGLSLPASFLLFCFMWHWRYDDMRAGKIMVEMVGYSLVPLALLSGYAGIFDYFRILKRKIKRLNRWKILKKY